MNKKELIENIANLQSKGLEIIKAKNNDYAEDIDPFKNFRYYGKLGFLVRMSDKFARIDQLLIHNKNNQVKDESVNDSLLDLANYCYLLLSYLTYEEITQNKKSNQRWF